MRRESPFGEPERGGKRSLYRIDDPFLRLWFRVVAAHRALLTGGSEGARRALLEKHWPQLVAASWEDLTRSLGPQTKALALPRLGPAQRWWAGSAPEWDFVAESGSSKRLVLGEAKWSERPLSRAAVDAACRALAARPEPQVGARYAKHERRRVLFAVDVETGTRRSVDGVQVITARELFAATGE